MALVLTSSLTLPGAIAYILRQPFDVPFPKQELIFYETICDHSHSRAVMLHAANLS